MAYLNGRIPTSALTHIGDGLYLEGRAGVAWMAARAAVRAETGTLPLVIKDGAYRDIAGQEYWRAWWTKQGTPGNASVPGYSTHGLGKSVDINNISRFNLPQLERIMARYGFRRNIPRESWHFTHDGSTTASDNATQIEDRMAFDDAEKLTLNQLGEAIVQQILGRGPYIKETGTVRHVRDDLHHIVNVDPNSLANIHAAVKAIQPGNVTVNADLTELAAAIRTLPADVIAALKIAL